MDEIGHGSVIRLAGLLVAFCAPLASFAQVQERWAAGPAEASTRPMTHRSARRSPAPAARFTFSDRIDARPISEAAPIGNRAGLRIPGKSNERPVPREQNHGHILQTGAWLETEENRPETPTPATVGSSANPPEVRNAAREKTATTQKQWPQGGPKYEAPMPPEPPDFRALVTRFVFGTAAVLVACVACLWLARRWLSHNVPAGKADGRMKLVATVSLSNRSSLQLVDIEGHKVLVGSDASGIKTVTPLTESFLDNLEQAAEEQVGDDRERFPFDALTRQGT